MKFKEFQRHIMHMDLNPESEIHFELLHKAYKGKKRKLSILILLSSVEDMATKDVNVVFTIQGKPYPNDRRV